MERKQQLINIPEKLSENLSKHAIRKINKFYSIRGRNPVKQLMKKLKIKSSRKRDDAIKRDIYRQVADKFNNEMKKINKATVIKNKLKKIKGIVTFKINTLRVVFIDKKNKTYEKEIGFNILPFESNRLMFEGQSKKMFNDKIMEVINDSPVVGYYLNGNLIDLRKDEPKFVNNINKFIKFNKIPNKVKQSKIKEAGVINLDGFIKNEIWDTKSNKCVPDWIIYKYKHVKGFVKKCNYDSIQELSNYGMYDVDTKQPNKYGYTLNHIRNWCYNVGVNLYVMNDGELELYDSREKIYKNVPLIIEIKNNHLYPIIDTQVINKIRAIATNNIKCDIFQKSEKDEKDKHTSKIMNVKKIKPTKWFCDIMEREDLMTYENKSITYVNGSIKSFKLDDKLYIADYDEELHTYYGEQYVGQNEISILTKYVEDISRGYMNIDVKNALFEKNVKNRIHIGKGMISPLTTFGSNLFEKGFDLMDENIYKYDINKHYRYVMENAMDDFIQVDFNSLVVEKSQYDGKFGLYYIETDDLTLLHQSNWYSNKIIEEAIKNNIRITVKYFITNCKRIDKNILKNVIQKIDNEIDDEKVKKLVINALSGYMGKTHTKNTYISVDTDINKVWEKYFKLRNVENRDLFFENIMTDSGKCYHLYGETNNNELIENRLPIYIQILDWANIVLYNHIKKIGGVLVARKVDAFYIMNPENEPILDDKIGGLKTEEKSYVCEMDTNRHVNYTYEKKNWKNLLINDSDKWEEILQKNESFMLLGRAGTGKTYVLKKIKEHFGNKCVCLAYTNKATNNLNGITIHKWLKMKDNKIVKSWLQKMMSKTELIIIDEISMIGKDLWKIFEYIKQHSNIKFILAGDYRQLPPIEDDTDYFNHPSIQNIVDFNKIELTKVKRYDTELYEASEKVWNKGNLLGKGLNQKGVKGDSIPLSPKKGLKGISSPKKGLKGISSPYLVDCNICWTNKKRKQINKICNEYWAKKSKRSLYVKYDGEENLYNEDIILYDGVKLLVNVNNNELRKNETLILQSFDDNNLYFENDLTIHISNLHKYFILGYCITVYKCQGDTYDGPINIYEMNWLKEDKRYLYTAITRTTKFKNITFM